MVNPDNNPQAKSDQNTPGIERAPFVAKSSGHFQEGWKPTKAGFATDAVKERTKLEKGPSLLDRFRLTAKPKFVRLAEASVMGLLFFGGLRMWNEWDVPKSHSLRETMAVNDIVSDEIVVDLVDSITPEQIASINADYGIQLRPVSKSAPSSAMIMVAKTSGVMHAKELIKRMAKDSRIDYAGPQNIYHAFSRPNDTYLYKQWNLQMIEMETAWEYAEGEGAVVAVIDSGCMLQNGPNSVKLDDFDTTQIKQGYDFVDDDGIPEDVTGHGTHVAGTIAEATNNGKGVAGVAPKATILPVKVIDSSGRGSEAQIVEGIRWAVDQGANIINLSLGSRTPSILYESVIDYAHQKGVFVACAAGNEAEPTAYPAAYTNAFAVSAVADTSEIASYSNYGPEIDIAAPGGDAAGLWRTAKDFIGGILMPSGKPVGSMILQQSVDTKRRGGVVSSYLEKSGTSMACPHVAGVAALLWERGVRSPDEIRSMLRRSAKPKKDANLYGAGLLDAGAAVRLAGKISGLGDFHRLVGSFVMVFGMLKGLGKGGGPTWLIRHWRLIVAVGCGSFFPEVLLGYVGTTSKWNLIGHSVVVPLVLAQLVGKGDPLFTIISWFALGVGLNLSTDVLGNASPFNVLTTSTIKFWLVVNIIAICWLFLSHWLSQGAALVQSAQPTPPTK
jgi:subtilisin family serine protease